MGFEAQLSGIFERTLWVLLTTVELTLEKSPTGDLCIAIVSFSSVGQKKNFLR